MAKSNGKSTKADAFEKAAAAPTEAMKQGFERAMSFAGDFGEISRGNIAAMSESAAAARKGMEAINARAMEYVKSSMENGVKATQSVTTAKSFHEAIELQTSFAKSSFENYVSELNAMAGLFSSTMRETVEPLNARAGYVVEKLQGAY